MAESEVALLLEAGAVFATLAVAGAVARRIGLSVIPFYLVGGILVGPAVAGELGGPAILERQFVTLFAELGIVLLLFFLGLEFSIDRLLESRRRITRAGVVDLANLVVGLVIGLAFGWSLLEAFVLGGVVYISSSAIITKSLIDQGWIANAESEPILGTLVFEDLFIALYLAVLSGIMLGGGDVEDAAVDVGLATGFLVALVLLVYFGNELFDRLLDVDSNELFVIRALAAAVLIGGVALELGVSEAVAAFFVGMAVGSTGQSDAVEHLLMPVRDLFAAVFFFWIGLETDPAALVATAGLLVLLVVLTTPTKLVSGYLGGRAYDLDARRSFRVGAGMVTRGEFSLIIATLAAAGSTTVLTETIPLVTVGYVLAMSVIGTTLMQYSDAVWDRLPRRMTG
jgi:CPA2 family monovalent cation:H+ antiporter-2